MDFFKNIFRRREVLASNLLYIVYFLLGMYYPFFSFMQKTFPGDMFLVVYIQHMLFFLLLLKAILQKNSVFDWFFLIVLLYLCRKSYQYNYDFYNIFGTMMLLCCSKKISIDKVVKLDLYIRIIRSVLFIGLPFVELMPYNVSVGSRNRIFFGWTHPNMMGLDFLLLSLDIMYLRRGKRKWYDCFIYIVITIFLNITANSRTAEIVILLLTGVHLLSFLMKESLFHKLVVLFSCCATLTCFTLPYIGRYLYLSFPEYHSQWESTILIRIQQTTYFIEKNYGVGFYGFPIENDDCLDMLSAYVSLHWGIAAAAVIIICIGFSICMATKEHNTYFLILLSLLLIYGCAETAHIYPVYSYFPLIFGYYVMNNNITKLFNKKMNIRRGEVPKTLL